MTLTMRPTGLSPGIYKNRVDYSVFCGEWRLGRIYENRSGPRDPRQRWFLGGAGHDSGLGKRSEINSANFGVPAHEEVR
jgi:hypothetical protein